MEGAAGEAGDILFASPPYPTGGASLPASSPLGNVAEGEEGESRISPPATAGAERSGGLGGQTLARTALAVAETCEKGTSPVVRHSNISGGAGENKREDPEHEQRHVSEGVESTHVKVATDGTLARGSVGPVASQDERASLASVAPSAGGGQGRRRSGSGSGGARKARKKRAEEPSRGNGGPGDESPAKIDSEWENEIAKNILSLYQTKLKVDLDVKKNAKENELMVRLPM